MNFDEREPREMNQAFLGTSQQAFTSLLAGSEHRLPVDNFAVYAGEVFDMVSFSMNDDPCIEHQPEFVTWAPDNDPLFDGDDADWRLPRRFRRRRQYSVWLSPRAKAARQRKRKVQQ